MNNEAYTTGLNGPVRITLPTGMLVFVVLNFLFYLNLSLGTPICFDDCLGYIKLMQAHSLSEYVREWVSMWRSWFVPFVFSWFGAYDLAAASSIVLFQTAALYFSWLLFAYVVADFFSGRMRAITFVVLLLCVYGQQYYVLNKYLISDSLGMSAVLVFLSLALRFRVGCRRWPRAYAFSFLAAALCAAGARDANVMIVVAGLIYVVADNYRTQSWKSLAGLSLGVLLVCANQLYHASPRHQYNMTNILAGFVLPNPEIRGYFVERGVPIGRIGPGDLKPQPWCKAEYMQIVGNQQIEMVPPWALDKARRVYFTWLLSHPGYVVTQSLQDRACILGQSFAGSSAWAFARDKTGGAVSTRPETGAPSIRQAALQIAPHDYLGLDFKLVMTLVLLAVFSASAPHGFKRHSAVAVFLVVLGVGNAVASYFADLWEPSEMLRHAFVGSVLFNTGFVTGVLSAAACLLSAWSARRHAVAGNAPV